MGLYDKVKSMVNTVDSLHKTLNGEDPYTRIQTGQVQNTIPLKKAKDNIRVPKNKKEAQFMAPGYLKILNDCANIVNNSINPDVFFDRYELLIAYLQVLSKMERWVKFNGQKPHEILDSVTNKRAATINDFIDRFYGDTVVQMLKLKTDKSRENKKEKFYQKLNEHTDLYLPQNLEYIEKLNFKL